MSKKPLAIDQIIEQVQRRGRILLHQLKRPEDVVEKIKEECEKEDIELFRNIHKGNQLLKQLCKTTEREDILRRRISQLEIKVQKLSEKLSSIIDILQKKL